MIRVDVTLGVGTPRAVAVSVHADEPVTEELLATMLEAAQVKALATFEIAANQGQNQDLRTFGE